MEKSDNFNKIYNAVRKTYGNSKEGDDLVDLLYDMAEAFNRVERGA